MAPKPLSAIIPGCSWSSGVYTIPVSALNAILTSPMSTTVDSGAGFIYSILECLFQQQNSGVLQNYMASISIDAKNSTKSVYETSQVRECLHTYIYICRYLLKLCFFPFGIYRIPSLA